MMIISILVQLTFTVEFQLWRKYMCNVEAGQVQQTNISTEQQKYSSSKATISLAITDEGNLIERPFGQEVTKPYMTQQSMNFTGQQIIQLISNRYGITAGNPSQQYDLVISEDFTHRCKGRDLKVLVNENDYMVCTVYKVSLAGVETDISKIKDRNQRIATVGQESLYFKGEYGKTNQGQQKTKEEWMKTRYLGIVPIYIHDKQKDVCTFFTLHVPNNNTVDSSFSQYYKELIDFAQSVKPDPNMTEIQTFIDLQASNTYDQSQVLNSASKKATILQSIQEMASQSRLNSNLLKFQASSQLSINQADIQKNNQIKDLMSSLGGSQFVVYNQANMNQLQSQSFAYDVVSPESIQNPINKSALDSKYLRQSGINTVHFGANNSQLADSYDNGIQSANNLYKPSVNMSHVSNQSGIKNIKKQPINVEKLLSSQLQSQNSLLSSQKSDKISQGSNLSNQKSQVRNQIRPIDTVQTSNSILIASQKPSEKKLTSLNKGSQLPLNSIDNTFNVNQMQFSYGMGTNNSLNSQFKILI